MTVQITPRDTPSRVDVYGGITRIESDGLALHLVRGTIGRITLGLTSVAAIALDEHGGGLE